ncbi:MAG: class II D-tagatose-bisphosphate aldolase, non-catalytic subunit [Albidovulum sp.]|nr:class II D-tagatose-bisphosphate aldolase, non-catalytic subunit [Albidovulum sp.]
MTHPLLEIPEAYHRGQRLGIASVCSAHPVVIEAALEMARDQGATVLIEATCNQVNQDGGYTGMAPADFGRFVERICAKVDFERSKIVLGGDHLGPGPWKHLRSNEAMAKAKGMVRAYAEAGFAKLHLDTSMGCRNEPVALVDRETAWRAARLAAVAEEYKAGTDPIYVIGTEVPVPGGATHSLEKLEITLPEAVVRTYEAHKSAFEALGLQDAFSRVVALVVQPGVEFSHSDVTHFDPPKAQALSDVLESFPGIVFEAHSTDYQTAEGLRSLVDSGFAILKVGPSLTFALREALYALDAVADILDGRPPVGTLMAVMDEVMRATPRNWRDYYAGTETEQWLQRHFSYSDRIRYYWPSPRAEKAVSRLRRRLNGARIPAPVSSQFLPGRGAAGSYDEYIKAAIQAVLHQYERACSPDRLAP